MTLQRVLPEEKDRFDIRIAKRYGRMLRRAAQKKKTSINKLLRSWIEPKLEELEGDDGT